MKKRLKWIIPVCVLCVAVVAIAFFWPRAHKFQGDQLTPTQKDAIPALPASADPGLQDAKNEKICPLWDAYSLDGWLDTVEPRYKSLFLHSNYIVRGTITKIQYGYTQVGKTEDGKGTYKQFLADTPETLTKPAEFVRYTLQVNDVYLGSLGLDKQVQIDLPGDVHSATHAALGLGQKILVFISSEGTPGPPWLKVTENPFDEPWTATFLEHGVFTISPTGEVYALSNLEALSCWDGKDISVLTRDIKQTLKQAKIK